MPIILYLTALSLAIVVINSREIFLPGDIMLGGLFPIHEAGRNATSQCGKIKADQGVQRMVAMLFALDSINNQDQQLLDGVKLGAQILDTCSVETHALEQSLAFIRNAVSTAGDYSLACTDSSSLANTPGRQRVAGVIGAASSQVSVMVASMMQLFKIPMLSYSSTGVDLSEKPRFAYFSRVVPPDNLQAKAMAHLVARLGWNYVHAIADTGSYGERGMDSFRAAATEMGVCIDGDVHKVSRRWTDDQFEELLIRMRHTNKARGVVMFVDEDNLRRFLSIMKRMILRDHPELMHYFWFIGSDSWGLKTSVIKGFEDIVQGSITIAPKMRYLKGFDEYFGRQGPTNTFLSEYWQSMNCSNRMNENFQRCFDSIGHKFKQESYVPFVFEAVTVMANALRKYIDAHCGSTAQWHNCYLSKKGFDGYELQQLYRNTSIIDAIGDGMGEYTIFQLSDTGGGSIYQRMGRWLAGNQLELKIEDVQAGLMRVDPAASYPPVSVCAQPCDRGHYRAYQDQSCCWTCIPCDVATSIIVNETSCLQCDLGWVPNEELDACRPIVPVHMEWDSSWALVPSAYSICGLLATFFVVSVFARYNDTPVIMASGRELCYCMLVGIAMCYLVTFLLVSQPSASMCALSRLLVSLSMAAIYAAILVKANRLARVFKPSSAIRPRFISPLAQVGITASIVCVQLVGSIISLAVDPPDTAIEYPTRTEAVLTCKANASHLLISLAFNMFLILACTLYAFKTRKIPENFNEARLIGFTMYSTCIIWLAFAPIYFATQHNFRIQITSLCMCISLSGSVALACFFAPKVYIVLWQPYKNVRTPNSAVGKLVNSQMRFISHLTTPYSTKHMSMRGHYDANLNQYVIRSENQVRFETENSTSKGRTTSVGVYADGSTALTVESLDCSPPIVHGVVHSGIHETNSTPRSAAFRETHPTLRPASIVETKQEAMLNQRIERVGTPDEAAAQSASPHLQANPTPKTPTTPPHSHCLLPVSAELVAVESSNGVEKNHNGDSSSITTTSMSTTSVFHTSTATAKDTTEPELRNGVHPKLTPTSSSSSSTTTIINDVATVSNMSTVEVIMLESLSNDSLVTFL